jgi:hypothetical protein
MKVTPIHWFTVKLDKTDIVYKTIHETRFFGGCRDYQEVDCVATRENIINYLLHKGMLPSLNIGEGYKVLMDDPSFGKISAGVPFNVAISLKVGLHE